MNFHQLKQRRDEIVTRRLQIAAELAEMKRAWIVDGATTDQAHRATLEAEQAQLQLEQHQLVLVLNLGKKVEARLHSVTSHAVLIALLKERGMGDVVIEANRLAIERQALLTGAAHAA